MLWGVTDHGVGTLLSNHLVYNKSCHVSFPSTLTVGCTRTQIHRVLSEHSHAQSQHKYFFFFFPYWDHHAVCYQTALIRYLLHIFWNMHHRDGKNKMIQLGIGIRWYFLKMNDYSRFFFSSFLGDIKVTLYIKHFSWKIVLREEPKNMFLTYFTCFTCLHLSLVKLFKCLCL